MACDFWWGVCAGKLGFLAWGCWAWTVGESVGVAPASPRATAPHDGRMDDLALSIWGNTGRV